MSEKQPVYVLPEHVSRTLGKDAQRNNILAAKIIADIVKTTLGPKGMDKMLVDAAGDVIVTNDGVTILEEMEIDHPAAKMLVEIAKTQEHEVGDGTTTAALLAGKLLEHAEKLLDRKIHPTVIVKGYRKAAEKSHQLLQELALPVRDAIILRQIAMTAMTGKGAEGHKEKLADLIVKAAEQVAAGREISLNDIKVQKLKGQDVQESEIVQGLVLERERSNSAMPSIVKDAKVLLVDFSLEIKSPESEAKIAVSTPEQLDSFLASEERYLKMMTDKILSTGANAVFCQKGIDDVAQYYLAQAGVFACRRVSKSDMEFLSRATGAKILSNLHDVHASALGDAKEVEEKTNGDDHFIYFRGCQNQRVATLILRGQTVHVVDEIERAVKDGLGDVISTVKSGKIVPGGGAIEIELARRLRVYAKSMGGREQLAIEEFAHALESIPESLAENAGLDPLDILTELRKRHEAGMQGHGLNLFTDTIEDTLNAGIVEPLKVKTQAISSASEVAMMILRIDDVLVSKRGAQQMPRYEGMD